MSLPPPQPPIAPYRRANGMALAGGIIGWMIGALVVVVIVPLVTVD
jgi:hypothetical protein